jgi:hypothetical protein
LVVSFEVSKLTVVVHAATESVDSDLLIGPPLPLYLGR